VGANRLIPTAEVHVSVLALAKVLEHTVAPAIAISVACTRLGGKEEYHWITTWCRDTALALATITVVNIPPFVKLAFDEIVHFLDYSGNSAPDLTLRLTLRPAALRVHPIDP
jgi:hypothetical protein